MIHYYFIMTLFGFRDDMHTNYVGEIESKNRPTKTHTYTKTNNVNKNIETGGVR